MTVADLEDKLSFTEYLGWLDYFKQTSHQPEAGPPNMLDSPDGLIKGFGL